jgi:choline dehydrogenase-like flavoprotein
LTRFTPRGSPADYDGWRALGATGWGWEDVLPYFLKLESDVDFGDRPWHGDRGPMPSTRHLDLPFTDIASASIDALETAGFAWIDDHNEPGAVGAGRMPMNVRGGRRVTTAEAYLPPGETPSNLAIRADSPVDSVIFDGGTAVGVRLADGTVVEGGRVVLCAGVYGSPTILLRSGIGRHGGRVHLPGVGENLVDHPSVYLERVGLRSNDPLDAPLIELPNLDDPHDVTRLAEGYRWALEVANDSAVRRRCIGAAPTEPHDLEAHIRRELFSVPHTVGTCAIGSVVDDSGNVFGVDRLTVADASIMPDVPSGFSHVPTIMIAERLAAELAAA